MKGSGVRGEEEEWREGGRIIQNYKYLTPGNVQ